MMQFAFKALSSPDNDSPCSKIKITEKVSAADGDSTLLSTPAAPTSSQKSLEANSRLRDLDSFEVPDDLNRSKVDESFDSSRDLSLSSDAVSKLLKPVKEKSFSKEAEEVRITKLYRFVLRVSSENASSGLTIKPLLENIVESFVLRCLPLPPHLMSIKFASCKLLANCCMKDNELDRALKLLIQAIQLDSTDLSLWFKVASASIKLCQTELATSALSHILNERPSHPFALHLALPFFLGISELETCLELSVRTLLIDPANEAAIYCIQRVLQLQPSLYYLAERVLIFEPNLLSLPLSEDLKRQMDSRVSETREGYLKQLQRMQASKKIKTVKFSKPLSSLSWECLTSTVIEMFDLLDAEQAINSVLDLASLFPDGAFPEKQTQASEAAASSADQELSPAGGVSTDPPSSLLGSSQPPGKGETDSSDNLMETDEASVSPDAPPDVVAGCENKPGFIVTQNPSDDRGDRYTKTQEEYDSSKSLSLSRARRNRRLAAEKWRLSAANDSSPASGSDAFVTADGTAVSSRRVRTGASASHQLHRHHHDHHSRRKQKWTDLATTLRSLLPASYREIAHTFEREHLDKHEELSGKAVVDGDSTDHPLTLEDGQCYVVGRDRQQQEIDSESGLVVEFLRVAQEETVNVVTLGVALLLQLSAVEKPWCLRFATAYLKLSSRIRPSLPAWSPNHVESDTPEQRHTDSCGTYELLPASLIRLRCRPSPSQLARLHLTYLEVRLDALAYTQSTSNRHAPLEDPLSALEDAVLADSKRFHTSDQTIPHHDLTLLVRAISRLPEDSLEARTLQIRVVWMNYELSSLAHDYEGMREYLLQVKEFVSQNGPFHRPSSTRNHLINSARIGELLTEVDDLAVGDRLLALSNTGDFRALISCFEECLRSCSIAKRKVSSSAFRSGLYCDQLCRISSILHPPLSELHRRITETAKQLNNPDDDDGDDKEEEDVDTEQNMVEEKEQRQLGFVLRCYDLGLRTISFLLSNTVNFERLSAFKTLPDDQKTALDEALHLGTVALDLLVRCWDVVVSVMSTSDIQAMFAEEKAEVEKELPANMLAQSHLFRYRSESASGDQGKVPNACKSEQVPLSLTFGHVCSGLRLAVDWLAWRLKAVGVLGLQLPPVSLSLVASVYEMLFQLESDLPLNYLPEKLAIYRALLDLRKTPENSPYHSQLRHVLRSAQPGYVLCLSRGHAPSPPSLSLLHVFHELLTLVKSAVNPAQTQSSDTTTGAPPASSLTAHAGPCSSGLGRRLLRHSIFRFAERMQALSLAYLSLTAQDWFSPANSFAAETDDDEGEERGGGGGEKYEEDAGEEGLAGGSSRDSVLPVASTQSGTTEMCTGRSSTASNCGADHGVYGEGAACWPVGSIKMGEALAQAVHCICGLKIAPSVASLTTSNRFKIASPSLSSPRPDAGGSFRSNNVCLESEAAEEEEPESQSCATPTPLWLVDAALFLDTVEDHWLAEDGETNNLPRSGVWWDDSPSKLDWQIAEVVFLFYHPSVVPEYDSLKAMSISAELSGWLTEVVKLLPTDIEAQLIPEDQIKLCMSSRGPIPRHNFLPSSLLTLMYYLLGDYHMKNNNFELAIDFYVRDLRVEPRHADSWASLALIYSSQLEQILNMTDLRTERVSSRSVSTCLRCFEVAIELQPSFVTLLTERGCLAYQLHSYAARLLKKAETRTFQESHMNLCRNWHHKMLNLAFTSYCTALSLEASGRKLAGSPQREKFAAADAAEQQQEEEEEGAGDGSPCVDEEWLYFYMLTKCAEKAGPGGLFLPPFPTRLHPALPTSPTISSFEQNSSLESYADWVMRIVSCYQHTADVLQAAGAKYPRKIVVYNKLPYLAVEAVEVFYRAHAFALKVLLRAGKPQSNSSCKLPLVKLADALLKFSQSAFVIEPGKNGRNRHRKRPAAPQPEDSSPCKLSKCSSEQVTAPADLPTGEDRPQTATPADAATVASDAYPSNAVANEDASSSTAQAHVHVTTNAPDQSQPTQETSAVLSDAELWLQCVDRCREALELVLRRLPLHYKCMYRLAHLHFTLESDLDKSMAILMGPFDHVTKVELGGLFKDRRQSNFFHGVWRIPTSDIDRSGNFAAHMYRSTSLVLEVLKKRGDWRRLLQVFHQLRKQPPEDKRGFLSEADRVFLARSAFNLVYPALRLWLSELTSRTAPIGPGGTMMPVTTSVEALRRANLVTMDTLNQIYRLHCVAKSRCADAQAQKAPGTALLSANNSVAAGFAELLSLAYHLCPDAWDASGPSISTEAVLKRCSELMPQSPSKASSTVQRVNLPLQGALSTS